MRIDRLDHLVLTVRDVAAAAAFYTRVLGFRHVVADGRESLHFGRQKINLHLYGHEREPKAHVATPGSADLCFVSELPIEDVAAHLGTCGVPILLGPIERTGAEGRMISVYFRDPDLNLIEVSRYC
jgi:catechol 2,3-dioxygenase-like lactoylglutathione lyase family enzyme